MKSGEVMETKMECRNCGSPILEGDRFCSKCGTRVAEEMQAEEVRMEEVKAEETGTEAAQAEEVRMEAVKAEETGTEAARSEEVRMEAVKAEEAGTGTPMAEGKPIPLCIPEEEPSKPQNSWKRMFKGRKAAVEADRLNKWIPRVVLGLFGVIIVVLLANSARLINSYHRNFSTPEEYYRWVERKTVQKNAKTLAEYYENYFLDYLRRYDSRTSGEIRLELGNAGREMMESVGLDPWFGEGSITCETIRRSGVEQSILGMEIEGKKLFSMDAVMDLRDEAVYLGFPGLTEKYLALDTGEKDVIREFENVFDMEPEEYLRFMELLEAFYRECPDKKQAEALANRYLELLLDSIDDVKIRMGKTVRVDSVAQTCTTLEIYLDKDDIRNMLSGFLKELKEDSEIESLLYQVFELVEELDSDAGYYRDAEEFYEAFQDRIDEILDDMDYYITYHNELDMTVYVDDKGQIIGRTMEFPNSWDEISVSYLFPHRGSRFGYKASVVVDGEEMSISGSGKEFGNKIDGNFTFKYDGNGIVDVEVENLNLKSLKKGYLYGRFTVTASSGIRRLGDMGIVYSYLSDLQLILNISMDGSFEELGIELREDRELWGALTMTVRSGSGKKISVPTTKRAIFVDDDSDFADWWDTIEWEKLIKNMDKAGMPSDTIERVEEYSEMDPREFMDEFLKQIWYWLDI